MTFARIVEGCAINFQCNERYELVLMECCFGSLCYLFSFRIWYLDFTAMLNKGPFSITFHYMIDEV